MPVKHSQDIESVAVAGGVGVTKKTLISLAEAPNFEMRCFIIQPGGNMPRHTNTVEHEQYVLTGRARICIGEEEFDVRPGDVVFIPAGLPHWYQNSGTDVFQFICVVPNKPDTITLVS